MTNGKWNDTRKSAKNPVAYKKSKYNIIIDRPEGCFLWNTYSNALIRLNEEGLMWFDAFDGTQDTGTYFETLERNGCIVRNELNETGKLLYEEKAVMLDPAPESMHFTIAPGLGCNYSCPYCFERGHGNGGRMSPAVVDAALNYIINKTAANPNLKQLEIRWFGGEPLLYMDIIEKMSIAFMDWCAAKDILYTAGIVTNGRYLTRETAERLKKMRVGYVQLSMDGIGKHYEQQKGAFAGDFDAVIENLKASADLLQITVRINVSDTINEACELTDFLLKKCGLDGKIKVYAAHVRDYEGRTADEEQEAHAHFLEMEGKYISLFKEEGPYKRESLAFIPPKRRCTTCKSVCSSNYCIGPAGELYRCEHHYGMSEHEVGNVLHGQNYPDTELDYLRHKHLDHCLECSLFPVCLGGCKNDNIEGKPVLDCQAFLERQIDFLMRAHCSEKHYSIPSNNGSRYIGENNIYGKGVLV